MNKKTAAVLGLLLLTAAACFSQNVIEERYMRAAKEQLEKKDYEKSFNYINNVLNLYTEDSLPQNIEILGEEIYFRYLENIRDTRNMSGFKTAKDKLLEYPFLSSERINRLVRTINTLETQDANWGLVPTAPTVTVNADGTTTVTAAQPGTAAQTPPPPGTAAASAYAAANAAAAANATATASAEALAMKRENERLLERTKTQLAALEKIMLESRDLNSKEQQENLEKQYKLLESQKEYVEQALAKTADSSASVKSYVTKIVLGSAVVVAIILIIVLSVTASSIKNSKRQQEQFEATLQVVAQMARGANDRLSIGRLPDLYGGTSQPVGTPRISAALPEPEMTEEDHAELKQLAAQCEKLGVEIDRVTGRKNNSKNVAEMVFKMSHELNLSSFDSMLYFCAAMVYDAGFLLIDPKVFAADTLTDEDKKMIRNHVQTGIEQLDFIPERYRPVFIDAVLMHHENMDGSGYPAGLTGDKIPMVARLIHIAESFIALISRRSYRGIFDKETAINELKNNPNLYDESIVSVLESIV